MFKTERTLNEFLLKGFEQVMADIPDEQINTRQPGNGHPPLWVLGHLAICAELGFVFCGGQMLHPEWMPIFGPGSSDDVENANVYGKEQFMDLILSDYPKLGELASAAEKEQFAEPHGVALLNNTPIQTKGELVSHLLSTHFAFHSAQLSCWRRAAGHGPIF